MFHRSLLVWAISVLGPVLCALLWLSPVSGDLKVLAAVACAAAVAISCGAWWSRRSARRRRAFFITILLSPAVLMLAELALTVKDYLHVRQTAPLRLNDEAFTAGMLSRDPTMAYRLEPSRRYELWGGRVAIDANGFRCDRALEATRPPGVTRVILTGGSATFGWGVPDGVDIASCLERELKAHADGGRFEVINAAVPYFTSFQELSWYQNRLARFSPDILVVLDGRNDARYAATKGKEWRPASEGGIGETPFDLPPRRSAAQSTAGGIRRLLLRSALYRRLHGLADRCTWPSARADGRDSEPGSPIDARFCGQLVEHWRAIAADARAKGTRCIFALQPIIHEGKSLSPEETQMAHMWGDAGPAIRKAWDMLRRAVGQAQLPGAVVVDLTDAFESHSETLYLDECHYNALGSRIIARALAEAVRAQADRPTTRVP